MGGERSVGTSSPADGIRALAGPLAQRAGLVLEDVTITPAGRRRVVRVVVDLPAEAAGGVPMDAVAQVSHDLSAGLDSSDVMGSAPYVLEVSSPGIDRPLTQRRHWLRARGRLVRVQLLAGPERTGRLTAVDDAGIGFEDGTRVGWDDLVKGRVEVEFGRPAAAGDEDVLDQDVLDQDEPDDDDEDDEDEDDDQEADGDQPDDDQEGGRV
jgi:ribosome maturation factor RimP